MNRLKERIVETVGRDYSVLVFLSAIFLGVGVFLIALAAALLKPGLMIGGAITATVCLVKGIGIAIFGTYATARENEEVA